VRIVVLVLTVVVLAASAAAQAWEPGAGEATASGLYGFVRRGPVTPVCRVGRPCTAPVPNATLNFFRNGALLARTRTQQDGSYRIALAPGSYTVRVLMKLILGSPVRPPRVTVPVARFMRVDFSIDTRIR
jgi:hypothetical protein